MAFRPELVDLLDPRGFARKKEYADLLDSSSRRRAQDLQNEYDEATLADRASQTASEAALSKNRVALSNRGLERLQGLRPFQGAQAQPNLPPQYGPQPAEPEEPNLPPYYLRPTPQAPPDRDELMYEDYRAGLLPPLAYHQLTKPEDAAGSDDDLPMTVKEWKYYSALPPAEQARFIEMKRAAKTLDLGGESVVLGQGGEVAKRYAKTLKPGELPSTKAAQAKAVQTVEEGGQAAKEKTAKAMETAKSKMTSLAVAALQLQNAKKAFRGIQNSLSAGPGALPTEAGKSFDAATDALRLSIRSLTRTPGEGAMSDYESRLAQASVPNRGEYESAAAQKLDQLEDLLAVLTSGYQSMLQDVQPGAKPPKAKATPVTEADIDSMSEEELIKFLEAN